MPPEPDYGLEAALEAILRNYHVPAFLTYRPDISKDQPQQADRGDLASDLADAARRLLGFDLAGQPPCGAMVTMVWTTRDGKVSQAVTAWCGTRSGPCPYAGGSVLVNGRHTRTCRAAAEGQDDAAVVEA